MRSGQGFMLVYSITDSASFEDLVSIHAHLLRSKDADFVCLLLLLSLGHEHKIDLSLPIMLTHLYYQQKKKQKKNKVPLVLLGNKCDLEEERAVEKEEGQNLANRFGCCTFMESSAKKRINVEEVTNTLGWD